MEGQTYRKEGAYHIANNETELNPQRKNNFVLIVHGLETLCRVGADNTSRDYIKSAQEDIILGMKKCDTPKKTLGKISIHRGNSQTHYAGKPSWADMNFECYDYIGSNIKDTLEGWFNQSYNSRYDYIGKASQYKKKCELLEKSPDGELIRYWEIQGAFLTAVDEGSRDMDTDDIATISCTMSIDWAELKLPDDYNG